MRVSIDRKCNQILDRFPGSGLSKPACQDITPEHLRNLNIEQVGSMQCGREGKHPSFDGRADLGSE